MARRGQRASERVRTEVARLAVQTRLTPIEIHRKLFPVGTTHDDYVTSKTIQRLVNARRTENPETSPRWSFLSAEPDDAARLLDVACYIFVHSEGRLWLTQGLANWVLRLRNAAPSLPTRWVWWLAHTYQLIAGDPEPDTRALDLTLGTAPWIDEDQARSWREVLRCGDLLEDTDPRVLETLDILARLEGWPPLAPTAGTEPAAPDDAAAWYEPNLDAAAGRQGAAPATAPPG